ncbi:unnamed protein product [Orchesella dallaii]|uniref:Uncharacterized protein n=1 Tax=Orchesella dallaii TaxID=48710 RepID=A0ABP1S7N2_9HEXA
MGMIRTSTSRWNVAKLLSNIIVLTEVASPILLGIGGGLLPCSPPSLIVPLNPKCGGETEERKNSLLFLLIKASEFLVQSGINGILWKAIIGNGLTLIIHLLVGCKSQCSTLKVIGLKLETYRELQILNRLFNESYVALIFAIIGAGSVSLTTFSYTLLKIYTSAIYFPIPVKIWILLMIVDGVIVILYVCGLAGSVFYLSQRMIQKRVSGKLCLTKNDRYKQKVAKSFSPIKISFGNSNFIEKETPLKFIEFSIYRFVDLILIK